MTESLASKIEGADVFFKAITGALSVLVFTHTMAQSSGRLYDPEPPADSAYVRAIVAAKSAPMDVVVDGKVRVRALKGQEISDYLVLPEGTHTVALHATGKLQPLVSKTMEIVKGKSNTLAFSAFKADASTMVFEDRGNSNKLKATLAAYHVAPLLGEVDITTADSGGRVFGALLPGGFAALQVNPIGVNLSLKSIKGLASVKLEMSQGGTYSLVIFEDGNGRPLMKVFQSRVERYTGP
jgi:alginate O-acetyltransferase complex protein AlgF